MANLKYFFRCAANYFNARRHACPNCDSNNSILIETKYAVSALRRCNNCLMMFRTPVDTQTESHDFYNNDYTQGFTTDAPSETELARLLAKNFAGSEKDYTRYIDSLMAAGVPANAKLFDFGCSWGYGSYQFSRAGFSVTSSEVSVPRGSYARDKLGVNLVDFDSFAAKNAGQFDVFFSSHVIEHVPSPSTIVKAAMTMLKPGGLFIAFFPNGSAYCRAGDPNWSMYWGEAHPNMVDEVFLNRVFSGQPRLFASETLRHEEYVQRGDNNAFKDFRVASYPGAFYADDLGKVEMFFAARK